MEELFLPNDRKRYDKWILPIALNASFDGAKSGTTVSQKKKENRWILDIALNDISDGVKKKEMIRLRKKKKYSAKKSGKEGRKL